MRELKTLFDAYVISTSVNFAYYSKLNFHYETNDDRWLKKEMDGEEGQNGMNST